MSFLCHHYLLSGVCQIIAAVRTRKIRLLSLHDNNMGSQAKMVSWEFLSAQSQPQPCLVFSPQSSHWTIIFRDWNIAKNASKKRLQDVYFVFTLYYFLNITNYKVDTGLVTSGSKFLLVQKHYCTSPGLVDIPLRSSTAS